MAVPVYLGGMVMSRVVVISTILPAFVELACLLYRPNDTLQLPRWPL